MSKVYKGMRDGWETSTTNCSSHWPWETSRPSLFRIRKNHTEGVSE